MIWVIIIITLILIISYFGANRTIDKRLSKVIDLEEKDEYNVTENYLERLNNELNAKTFKCKKVKGPISIYGPISSFGKLEEIIDDSSLHNPKYQFQYNSSEVRFEEKTTFPAPTGKKIIVNRIISCLTDKIYDFDFYMQYFDCPTVAFFRPTEEGIKSYQISKEEGHSWTHYEQLDVNSQSDWKTLLNKSKNGELNYSVFIEITKKQGACLEKLRGISKINGDLSIRNPYLKSLGDIRSIGGELCIDDYSIRPPIDLNRLEYVGGNRVALSGKIKSFGNLREVKGSLNLRHCEFSDLGKLEIVNGSFLINKGWIENFGGKEQVISLYPFLKNKIRGFRDEEIFNKTERRDLDDLKEEGFDSLSVDHYEVMSLIMNKDFESVNNLVNSGKHISIFQVLYYQNRLKRSLLNPQIILTTHGLSSWFTSYGRDNIKSILPILKRIINKELTVDKFQYIDYKFIEKWIQKDNITDMDIEKRNTIVAQLKPIFSKIILESENQFRSSRGMKKVGEGWVAETDLFYNLKEHFKDEKIIQHARPKWLGRQHLDIWFPEKNIGIEYQGLQHDMPIEFFGGEDAFKKTKERDAKKKRLCEENNCILIEVRPGYKKEVLIEEVQSYFKR
tara:strand:- start:760 stop:2616 length:1857 start_codon:yes stop_codon:yes gene_type:complete